MHIVGYQIERRLGKGGMSSVYLALQESLNRHVALKIMATALVQDNTFINRFMREARLVARLVHPNIAKVFDIGAVNDHPYLAMEYIDGGTLRERIKNQPLPIEQVFTVMRDVTSALACAHAEGIIHRDIKPANILFRSRGSVVLGDFGIAKALAGNTAVTALTNATAIGTPCYMSPEQARGFKIDPRSDQYGLGTVLYECLTGHPPYQGRDSFAIAFQHIYEPIPALPKQAAIFQPLLNRLMAKEPDERFASDEDILRALDELQQEYEQMVSNSGSSVLFSNSHAANNKQPLLARLWRGLRGIAPS